MVMSKNSLTVPPPMPKCILHMSTILLNRFYFATIEGHRTPNCTPLLCFVNVDETIAYPYIQSYFGPPSLGDIYRYSVMMNALMSSTNPRTKIIHCTSIEDPEKRSNAAFLVAAYAMLYLYLTPRLVYRSLRTGGQPNYKFFCDTSNDQVDGRLKIMDFMLSLHKSMNVLNMCSLGDFDIQEYEFLHSCEEGVNMTWIVPNKLLAFMGPVKDSIVKPGKLDENSILNKHLEYFTRYGVKCMIRCNEPKYDAEIVTNAGIRHVDLFFPDGTCPSESIMKQFLQIVDDTKGAVAVHCKAGLGRTGVLIAAYLMQHYQYTADESVGWLRLCRPGSVIGVQHRFLIQCQPWLHYEGRIWRKSMREFGVSVDKLQRSKFGIYSINARLGCNQKEPDFVQRNIRSINGVDKSFY